MFGFFGRSERDSQQRVGAAVTCKKCAASINIAKFSTLPNEFSVKCERCGYRFVYSKAVLDVQETRG